MSDFERQMAAMGCGIAPAWTPEQKARAEARNRLTTLAKVLAEHGNTEECDAAANALRPYAARAMEKL